MCLSCWYDIVGEKNGIKPNEIWSDISYLSEMSMESWQRLLIQPYVIPYVCIGLASQSEGLVLASIKAMIYQCSLLSVHICLLALPILNSRSYWRRWLDYAVGHIRPLSLSDGIWYAVEDERRVVKFPTHRNLSSVHWLNGPFWAYGSTRNIGNVPGLFYSVSIPQVLISRLVWSSV